MFFSCACNSKEECQPLKLKVVGSSPTMCYLSFCFRSSVAEHLLYMQRATGSIPVVSIYFLPVQRLVLHEASFDRGAFAKCNYDAWTRSYSFTTLIRAQHSYRHSC